MQYEVTNHETILIMSGLRARIASLTDQLGWKCYCEESLASIREEIAQLEQLRQRFDSGLSLGKEVGA